MTDTDDTGDGDLLAAEYALGLLSGDESASARARALTDPGFATSVTRWQEQFAVLADEVPSVEPSRATKRRLMTRVFGEEPKRGCLASTGLWQGLAAVAFAATAFLGWQVANYDRIPTLYTAELTSADNTLRVLAVYDSVTGHIRITRTDGAAADGRDLELWAIAGDNAPVPVGILPDDAIRAGYEVPEAVQDALDGLTLAISDEPDGGSPTGAPTGAILAIATVDEI